jgi:hypothetical protein
MTRSANADRAAIALAAWTLFAGPAALAQIGGPYDLSWNTIDSGGTTSSGGGLYELAGTSGQIDAGAHAGGVYALGGGFWAGILDTGGGVAAPDLPEGPPVAFRLHPAAPNPFERETVIAFDLPRGAQATARIYNVAGALVKTLVQAPVAAGRHELAWQGLDDQGRRVAQGVYLLRLDAGPLVATRKLVLTR